MVKTRMSKKFDKCVKSVRKTVKARKGSNKESAAIAICTTTLLHRRGRTLKSYRKGRLVTQKKRKMRGGNEDAAKKLVEALEAERYDLTNEEEETFTFDAATAAAAKSYFEPLLQSGPGLATRAKEALSGVASKVKGFFSKKTAGGRESAMKLLTALAATGTFTTTESDLASIKDTLSEAMQAAPPSAPPSSA
jgi:hypothetical protein